MAGTANAASAATMAIFCMKPPRDIIVSDSLSEEQPQRSKNPLGSTLRPQPPRPGAASPMAARSADRYFELKSEIHRKLIGVLNLERVSSIPKDRVRSEIGRVVERLLEEERVPMTAAEQNKIIEEVLDEVLGLGPLEPLLKEPTISDILVNRYDKG